jgi:hypothetical protein
MPDKPAFSEWVKVELNNTEMVAAQVKDFLAQHLNSTLANFRVVGSR